MMTQNIYHSCKRIKMLMIFIVEVCEIDFNVTLFCSLDKSEALVLCTQVYTYCIYSKKKIYQK